MIRRKLGSLRARRTLVSLAIAVPALLLSAPNVRAVPSPMRYQNFHGAACDAASPASSQVNKSNAGLTVWNVVGGTTSMVTCPISWSQDSTAYPLLEVY